MRLTSIWEIITDLLLSDLFADDTNVTFTGLKVGTRKWMGGAESFFTLEKRIETHPRRSFVCKVLWFRNDMGLNKKWGNNMTQRIYLFSKEFVCWRSSHHDDRDDYGRSLDPLHSYYVHVVRVVSPLKAIAAIMCLFCVLWIQSVLGFLREPRWLGLTSRHATDSLFLIGCFEAILKRFFIFSAFFERFSN